jgi:hypothetical protein
MNIKNKYFRLIVFCGGLFLTFCQFVNEDDIFAKINITSKEKIDVDATEEDTLIFKQLINTLPDKILSLREYILHVGIFFIKTPYLSSTLEIEGEERLVINFRSMDCTTFVEYVTALALCFSNKKYEFDDFVKILTYIRYRSGNIDGYISRLHYFSDWLHDNNKKGIIDIVSNNTGDVVFDNTVDFMTSNPRLYKQLSDTFVIEQLKNIETNISTLSMKYITRDHIKNVENKIMDGDIIGFVSSLKGLDISHVGFVIRKSGKLHLLHASSLNKKVEISSLPLDDYLNKNFNYSGIVVGRIKR